MRATLRWARDKWMVLLGLSVLAFAAGVLVVYLLRAADLRLSQATAAPLPARTLGRTAPTLGMPFATEQRAAKASTATHPINSTTWATIRAAGRGINSSQRS